MRSSHVAGILGTMETPSLLRTVPSAHVTSADRPLAITELALANASRMWKERIVTDAWFVIDISRGGGYMARR